VSLVAQDPLPNAARLGDDAGAEIARWLRHSGVSLNLNFAVQAIERRDEELLVHGDGMSVTGTLVVMATGVAPRSELLAGTGVRLAHGAVPADETMRSELPDVLVAGDVGYAFNSGAGRPLRVEHWGDALAQGELAGRGAAGERVTWDQVPGFWSEIGGHTLKYAAWGDGYEESRFESRTDGGFVVRYGRDGLLVGVLTHQADDEYERGQRMIRERTRWS
jgi:NADPH-dependent 2,4-dienoyl-CoA reductase/sulfur reductase-like enzyme